MFTIFLFSEENLGNLFVEEDICLPPREMILKQRASRLNQVLTTSTNNVSVNFNGDFVPSP